MPRRARHLIPAQLPHRGEVIAAFAVLVLLLHLLLAQLTFVLAALFAAVSRTSRWRLWWLTGPATAGLAWTLAAGPRPAAAGFAAGPARILAYLGGHPLGHLAPQGAFAGVGDWLPRISPLYGLIKTVLSRPRLMLTDARGSDLTIIIAGRASALAARTLAISSS